MLKFHFHFQLLWTSDSHIETSISLGVALKYVTQMSLLCALFFAKQNQLLMASFAHCTFSGVRTFFRKFFSLEWELS